MTPIQTANPQGGNLLQGLIQTDPIGPVLLAGSQNYLINPSTGVLTPATPPSILGFPLVITGYPPQNPAPGAQYSPAGITFTNYTVGVASTPQNIELVNTGTATLNVSSISITGANASDFAQTNTCQPTLTLAPGANCVFTMTYTPSNTSAESAEISMSDNAAGSPHTASLTATGFVPTPPNVTVNPNSFTFLQTAIGSSSSMSFTISNSGTETLTISGLPIGGANPSEFSQTNNCNGSVAGGAMCTVNVMFQPQVTGQRTATITVNDNAVDPNSIVTLSGLGTTASNPVTVAVSGSSSATVQPNQPATFAVSVTSAAAYSGMINISCGVAPAGRTCSRSPSSIQAVVSSNPTTTPITVTVTPSTTSALTHAHTWYAILPSGGGASSKLGEIYWPFLLFGIAQFAWGMKSGARGFGSSERTPRPRVGALAAALGVCCAMAACSSSGTPPPPPPQNYTVTVTATSGTNTQTVNLSLTVQ
ncbi:MAG TPA: choice-of-anchor D domain-containing protein [Candidatus Acidoferrales bacterium]|nr:choice-of-anchor D domain-containing protein [Candidatus Acidoferrales bacterium]